MQYKLKSETIYSFQEYIEICSWIDSVDHLHNTNANCLSYNAWNATISASGPSETMLLLKYSNVLTEASH